MIRDMNVTVMTKTEEKAQVKTSTIRNLGTRTHPSDQDLQEVKIVTPKQGGKIVITILRQIQIG